MKAGITGPTGRFFIFLLLLVCLSGFAAGLECPEGLLGGDVDGNCQVDFADVLAVADQWLDPPGCEGHLWGVGGINILGSDCSVFISIGWFL